MCCSVNRHSNPDPCSNELKNEYTVNPSYLQAPIGDKNYFNRCDETEKFLVPIAQFLI